MCEPAAKCRGNAEERKSAVGDIESFNLLGFGESGDTDGISLIRADVLKGMVLFAIDEVVGRINVEIGNVDAGGGVPYADEFGGARIGERLEEDALEDAEDDGVAANSCGEGDERDGGKERGVRKTAEDLLQMGYQCSH